MQDWQKIEIIVKKVATVNEMEWKTLFSIIEYGGSVERRKRIFRAKAIVAHCLLRYFAVDFIADFYKCSYQQALAYLNAAKKLIKKDPNYEGVVSHIHYSIRIFDHQWIYDMINESNNAA